MVMPPPKKNENMDKLFSPSTWKANPALEKIAHAFFAGIQEAIKRAKEREEKGLDEYRRKQKEEGA